ncbi:glycosyl transferase family 1 [Acinetobacter johnsonii]|uniref:Glycosyl transferase family 1 n=2 Tax=Acinetobacter johnsonii TaxID=40214 RepID=A0A3Q8XFZ6_ACIJO|nr:glycosyl transferase family 1 [Acinetobacter johnsonii]
MRFLQYLPALAAAGIEIEVQSLFDDATLSSKYQQGNYGLATVLQCFAKRISIMRKRQSFDLLWIEKEALPWWPLWLEKSMLQGIPYILDYDDAWFHNYDLHRLKIVRQLFGRRLDELMANATLVIGGNGYLTQRAQNAGAPWVEVLPTVIDLVRYPTPQLKYKIDTIPTVVWIGSPSTIRYLQILHKPLQQLAQRIPFQLRVIGGEIVIPGVNVHCLPWSEDTEVENIASADVGVMPLLDSPWERGKCGYKLIQYMACGLPVVASPIGVNTEIVRADVNGYLASNANDWVYALEKLLLDVDLRKQMGQMGRQRVEQEYCLQVAAPQLEAWLKRVAVES